MKLLAFIVVMLLFVPAPSYASSIRTISLTELQERADYAVLAKVIKVVKEGNRDFVTITADSYLKGDSTETEFSFYLTSRGGLKDWSPELKQNDAGVFFLKMKADRKGVEIAYPSGVAIFSKSLFALKEDVAH